MTEIGMALSNPLHGERRAGTVGFPLPFVEVKIADESGNEIKDAGTPGELYVKGKTVLNSTGINRKKLQMHLLTDGLKPVMWQRKAVTVISKF